MSDTRIFAPSTARNREPILDVLRNVLPAKGLVLEIASGAGEHVTFFAANFPHLTFCPSDPSAEARQSISAWIAASGVANVHAPLALDVQEIPWPIDGADAIICINMTHISPWSATEALFEGAGRTLPAGAPLYLYGPYRRGGAHTAPSNAEFDASLRARNAAWGLRDSEDVAACAREKGFGEPQIVDMPANNLSVIFRRT
jgi:SAM-dependent methyltransferase